MCDGDKNESIDDESDNKISKLFDKNTVSIKDLNNVHKTNGFAY